MAIDGMAVLSELKSDPPGTVERLVSIKAIYLMFEFDFPFVRLGSMVIQSRPGYP